MYEEILDDDTEPPEIDFRFLNIVPTDQDLYNENPYIRPAKITEAYQSVEHYLDVQFRLLREDFLLNLRNGMKDYLYSSNGTFKNDDLRIYKKVKLVIPEVNSKYVGLKLYFGNLKYVNWRNSKRFMFGGLLMLSHDNFKSIIFATVSERDEKLLQKGFVIVEPCCQKTIINRDMYKKEYVMLESKIYFEPYKEVLNALQCMKDENFPMKSYIVEARNFNQPPAYLLDIQTLKYKNHVLPASVNQLWPSPQELNLDESQFRAFQHALTQEFAIIQGPPGTGKTFIALEIVSALLLNKHLWKTFGPIVVVCYTNHALDQFLEGISKCTKSIVRIGGRSKSQNLQKFTLAEKRKTTRARSNGQAIWNMYNTKRELEKLMISIAKVNMCIKFLTTPDAIVPLDCLRKYCSNSKILMEMKSNEELVEWLLDKTFPVMNNTIPMILEQKEINSNKMQIDTTSNISTDIEQEQIKLDDLDKRNDHCQMDDRLELNINFNIPDSFELIYPIKMYDSIITMLEEKMIKLQENIEYEKSPDPLLCNLIVDLVTQKESCYSDRQFFQQKLSQHPIITEIKHHYDNQKWSLYWTWVKRSYDRAMDSVNNLELQYRKKRVELDQYRELVDIDVLKAHEVVGLTTTCAARLHKTINALEAPIVLVEEAAEIFEAHVVCSMSSHCQHLILIGDHKQLRPKASVHEIGKKYNLNISLFERMILIKGNHNQLEYQHRMRPEIAQLITPSIYERLFNDESVNDYPQIKGLDKSLFFINHKNPESNHRNEESWINDYEAKFLIALARHLIKQGYQPERITILSTYTGQMFFLKKEAECYRELKGLQVTTVDNYQGEENQIILLSLVRNNGLGNIGFLKEENRVCVALSRAREGMYITGNMDDLLCKNTIWPKIRDVLIKQEAIGDSLLLRCQIHSDQITKVKDIIDFEKSPMGGCLKMCECYLPCGHICASTCHILDREHKSYQCFEPCQKFCPLNHPCNLKCWQKCEPCQVKLEHTLVQCGHTVQIACSIEVNKFKCDVKVAVKLPDCSHEILKQCFLPIEKCICYHDCSNRLPCGHACSLKCHVNNDPDHIMYKCKRNCEKIYKECQSNHLCKKLCYEECDLCPVPTTKKRSCGHVFKNMACHLNVEKHTCVKPCKLMLHCGHKCPMKCSEDCGNCQVQVTKISSCGHKIKVKCCEEATPNKCSGPCPKLLSCGHQCRNRCKDNCTTRCEARVKLTTRGICGHFFSVPCYLQTTDLKNQNLLHFCTEPCGELLNCSHKCKGTCGDCFQGRIHIPCSQPCSNILVCGHECAIPCRAECQPCRKLCEVKCVHSKCNKKCGEPCVSCVEPCTRKCEHNSCKKRCYEICNIDPCEEPCKKLLKCKHPCVGFCGERCPPLCRICNKEELTEIFFGYEEEPEARFILLEDCNHVFESKGLSMWLESTDGSVQLKCCPRCSTQIKNCSRFINIVKEHLQNVIQVKKNIFYRNSESPIKLQIELLKTLKNLKQSKIASQFNGLNLLLNSMENRGQTITRNKKRQALSSQELEAFRIQLQILEHMLDTLDLLKDNSFFENMKSQVNMLVKGIPDSWVITEQNVNDIKLELRRLNYMVQIFNTKNINDRVFDPVKDILFTIEKFTVDIEDKLKKEIDQSQIRAKEIIIAERQMILKVMGFTQGHWYKCKNGHFYAIGECGRPMQESTCPECGVTIGGTNHRLAEGNFLASEIDGASQPAYPQ